MSNMAQDVLLIFVFAAVLTKIEQIFKNKP